jgi:two-component system sensor histidine kinase KdpD
VRRGIVGSLIGVGLALALGGLMVPLRSHLSIATAGLVLIVPVVAGVVAGGYRAGLVSVAAGFLVYDFAFIRPYYTLTVGSGENWVVLGVYVVVMVLVARVVAHLERARTEAQRRDAEARRVFELSELLVGDRPIGELLATIVDAVQVVFGVTAVALLLPIGGRLTTLAAAGEVIPESELRRLDPDSRTPVRVGTTQGSPDQLRAVALTASQRPVGILAMRGLPVSGAELSLLGTFANHAALAIERAQLRQQALRSQVLEETEELRRSLIGAVSHDLRSPLATMKVASSTLLDPEASLAPEDTAELHRLLDVQTDRLTRLVTSLLDMKRYQAGVLQVDQATWTVPELVDEAVSALAPMLGERTIQQIIPADLPPVAVDHLLIAQVLVNLIDNAHRHAPPCSPITVSATRSGDRVTVGVSDQGPGVAASEREVIFDNFVRFDTGGRSGLGLAIAKTFVAAHGQRIWVDETGPSPGARFLFTLPVAGPAPAA